MASRWSSSHRATDRPPALLTVRLSTGVPLGAVVGKPLSRGVVVDDVVGVGSGAPLGGGSARDLSQIEGGDALSPAAGRLAESAIGL